MGAMNILDKDTCIRILCYIDVVNRLMYVYILVLYVNICICIRMASNFTYKSKESTTCAQCGRVVDLYDLKEGKYPKEKFKYNQKHRYKGVKAESAAKYLVCTDCFNKPQCVACKCVPDIDDNDAICCDFEICKAINLDKTESSNGSSNSSQPQVNFINFDRKSWKCQACKTRQSRTRQSSKRNSKKRSSNSNLRRVMHTGTIPTKQLSSSTFSWGSLSSYQWSILWNVAICKNFENKYYIATLKDIARYLKITDYRMVVKALNLLHRNNKYLWDNYKIKDTKYGIYFNKLLKDCGVYHYDYPICQIDLQPSQDIGGGTANKNTVQQKDRRKSLRIINNKKKNDNKRVTRSCSRNILTKKTIKTTRHSKRRKKR
jgi:hypothetical protein